MHPGWVSSELTGTVATPSCGRLATSSGGLGSLRLAVIFLSPPVKPLFPCLFGGFPTSDDYKQRGFLFSVCCHPISCLYILYSLRWRGKGRSTHVGDMEANLLLTHISCEDVWTSHCWWPFISYSMSQWHCLSRMTQSTFVRTRIRFWVAKPSNFASQKVRFWGVKTLANDRTQVPLFNQLHSIE